MRGVVGAAYMATSLIRKRMLWTLGSGLTRMWRHARQRFERFVRRRVAIGRSCLYPSHISLALNPRISVRVWSTYDLNFG